MATIAEINAEVDVAIAQMKAGNYSAAEDAALAVEAMLIGKPDTEFSKEKLVWDREAAANFAKRMAQKARSKSMASGQIVQIPVRRRSSALESN